MSKEEERRRFKRNVPGWVGIVLATYGGITLTTSLWSPEAYAFAGQTSVIASLATIVVGAILIVTSLILRRR